MASRAVHFGAHLAVGRVDDHDAVGDIDIGPYLSVDEFELVEPVDQLAFAAHGQFFLQTQVLVHYVYMRGAVTGVEIFAVACDAPALAWIVRLAEQFEAVGRIAENFAVPRAFSSRKEQNCW